jgi:hypothetical protein
MTFDPRTEPVTARVVLSGAMLMCINGNNWCELGLVQCPKHPKRITIRTNSGNNPSDPQELNWPANHDLIFNVKESRDSGVSPHPRATGNFSVNKILDLEGSKCHDKELPVLTHRLDGRRVGITAGRLYTHMLTPDNLQLVKWIDASDPGRPAGSLGHIAKQIGINIKCRPVSGAGVDIVDAFTGQVIQPLPALPNTWYEIDVDNDCSAGSKRRKSDKKKKKVPRVVGTDFRYLYQIVLSPSAEKFDLAKIGTVPTFPFPGVCETVNMSRTHTFGLT